MVKGKLEMEKKTRGNGKCLEIRGGQFSPFDIAVSTTNFEEMKKKCVNEYIPTPIYAAWVTTGCGTSLRNVYRSCFGSDIPRTQPRRNIQVERYYFVEK